MRKVTIGLLFEKPAPRKPGARLIRKDGSEEDLTPFTRELSRCGLTVDLRSVVMRNGDTLATDWVTTSPS